MSAAKTNGVHPSHDPQHNGGVADLEHVADVELTKIPKELPPLETLTFGANSSDHMLVSSYDPATGWSKPLIKPYGPLSLDPASSVFHYCPVAFEGMKAYKDPQGRPRLFRPEINMARFVRSADRAALPTFPPAALLSLIKQLVTLESKWIPQRRGYSLYIRPTIIGTKPTLGVAASSNALLYVILCPTGPYFVSGVKPIALLSSCDAMTDLTKCNPEGDPPTRSWPGGTGEYKLGINYAPSFEPQREAARRGYDQVLWLLDDINQSTKQKDRRVTEVGQMNFFMVVPGERGSMDLITPRLDGTILPGVTRSSVISLAHAHSASKPLHPTLSGKVDKINVIEKTLYMSEVARLLQEGKVTEMFGSATGAVITPIGKLGYEGVDYTIPTYEGGLGPLAKAFFDTICDIQEGHREWEDWSVLCDE